VIQLVEESGDAREPWTGGGIPARSAIRGLHSVRLRIGDPAGTIGLLTGLLGYERVDESQGIIRLTVNGDLAGHRLELAHGPGGQAGLNGLGTVHHVAMAVETADEQLRLRRELVALGYGVTEVLDRQYFQSIYFREPGGVLFEVATVAPGFAVDEPLAELGRELKLPPWEEANRRKIEAALS
jgi:glyoxalase family protein